MKEEHFAALDLGSNSFHLVTARVIDRHLQPLLGFKQKVHLANGLNPKQKLNKDAMQRGLDALVLCAQRLEGFLPEHVHVVATHTLREAKNVDVFIARAAELFPFTINIISGHEEARLIYKGVAQTSPYQGKRLVFDIGGGSTEVITGHEFEPDSLSSRPMGSVSYTKRFFTGGKLNEKRFKKALVAARSELEPIAAGVRKFGAERVIGTSGMIKAISKWMQLRDQSAPGQITLSQAYQCKDELLQFSQLENFDAPGVEPERKSILPAGLAILIALMEELEVDALEVHDAALREGVLYELTDRVIGHQDVRQRTVDAMAARYRIDNEHAGTVAKTAVFMLDQVAKRWELDAPEWLQRLAWAARLHEVGLHINSSGIQSHSGYIVEHADMPGFSEEEQLLLAVLVRHFRKNIKLSRFPVLHSFEGHDIHRLLALLRLAVLFNTDRQPAQLLQRMRVKNDVLLLYLTPEGWANPMLISDLAAEVKQQQKLGIQLLLVGADAALKA
ncbi:Ppx/GppA phosphatase family protein [Aliidiomarina soli]|uniref:Exopolyphosphatase n=1 Tax=Aliidiomarina soli TaxID=1928574 RepID=A0A432WJB3_9GAMM|nr:Ppx/GppA phosphatase family protein [Aliidiomarina soli]RUO33769.1 exopolyphosphatase [Aliidiomarina soli]